MAKTPNQIHPFQVVEEKPQHEEHGKDTFQGRQFTNTLTNVKYVKCPFL